jgi:hypothetical protein
MSTKMSKLESMKDNLQQKISNIRINFLDEENIELFEDRIYESPQT